MAETARIRRWRKRGWGFLSGIWREKDGKEDEKERSPHFEKWGVLMVDERSIGRTGKEYCELL